MDLDGRRRTAPVRHKCNQSATGEYIDCRAVVSQHHGTHLPIQQIIASAQQGREEVRNLRDGHCLCVVMMRGGSVCVEPGYY